MTTLIRCGIAGQGSDGRRIRPGRSNGGPDELLDEMEGEAKRKPDDEAAPLLKLVRRTRSSKSKEAMIKEAQHLEGIPVLPNEFDRYKDALNVQNGVINLKTGRLAPA